MEGSGTFGVVYSTPRFPFKDKFNFNNDTEKKENDIIELLYNNEVSKIFFDEEFYNIEKEDYLRLKDYNLPDTLFNKPLNYGLIDKDIVFGCEIYNYKWSGAKFDFGKIINCSPYQITFEKGKEICNDKHLDLGLFYEKIINLFNLIKYLNDNKILFDDFKLSNVLNINGVYKLSDYSSLIKIEQMTKNIFNDSFLNTSSYFIYLPILNKAFEYYICKKETREYEDLIDDEHYSNKECIDDTINYFILNLKNNIVIDFLDINNKNIKINILDLFKQIKNYKENFNKNEIYYNLLIDYLDNKYKDDNIKKLENLCKRINLYSLGIFLLYILIQKKFIKKIEYHENSLEIKFLKIICYSCLNFIIINEQFIFEPNIDFLIKFFF